MSQCVAVCCSALQCVAVYSSDDQRKNVNRVVFTRGGCTAVCCSALQCVAVCCSVLQCVALCGSDGNRKGVQ